MPTHENKDKRPPAFQINVKLAPGAGLPERHSAGAAAFDLCAHLPVQSEGRVIPGRRALVPFDRQLIPTGVSIAIPSGYCGLILPRSGTAHKKGLSLSNSPGLIDCDYRGEILLSCQNTTKSSTILIHHGDRIAQLLIIPALNAELREVDYLDETARGAEGFGSSGEKAAEKPPLSEPIAKVNLTKRETFNARTREEGRGNNIPEKGNNPSDNNTKLSVAEKIALTQGASNGSSRKN